jgi:hypothetical protein
VAVDGVVRRGIGQGIDIFDVRDVVPDFGVRFTSPGLCGDVGDAAGAGEVDEVAWGGFFAEAGEEGGGAGGVVDVAGVWEG